MTTIGAFAAKTHLSEIFKKVLKGEEFVVTKHGAPIARITPVRHSQKEPLSFISQMKSFRQGRKVSRKDVRAMIEEGRRF